MKTASSILLLLGAAVHLGTAQVYVSETFADGERATQNPPNSLQWYSTFASSMSVAEGAMTISPTSSVVRAATAYFTAPMGAVELGLGDMLTFSLTFTPAVTSTVTSPNGLRFGIFDSGGVRIDSDSNPTDITYLGYAAFVNPLTSNARLKERIGTGALITSLGVGIYGDDLAAGVGDGSTLYFEAGVSYTASLMVTRDLSDQWTLGFTMVGGDLGTHSFSTAIDGNVTRFDTISFGLNQDLGVTDFTSVDVSLAVIPEPTTATLLAGAGAVFLLVWRLRRRRVVANK